MVTSTVVVAWEAHNWFLNDASHALGAFLTSSGFAGTAALVAAIIAAKQVSGTRRDDRAAAAAVNDAKRRDQLWQRFEWLSTNRTDLGATSTARMLLALEREAGAANDPNLVDIVAQVRRRAVTTTAQRNT